MWVPVSLHNPLPTPVISRDRRRRQGVPMHASGGFRLAADNAETPQPEIGSPSDNAALRPPQRCGHSSEEAPLVRKPHTVTLVG
jgi:hypothetical protein